MIPKVIHFCWFGHNPLPASAQKCIASWRKYFPDYEIKEWNEDNFDVNIIPYTSEAYSVKKYAFVSDYVRFWVLYHYGGLYFDTDVEVIRPMDDIIERGAFMGIEVPAQFGVTTLAVAPGLGIGCNSGLKLYQSVLERYENLHFLLKDGNFNSFAVVRITTEALLNEGLKYTNEIQKVADIWIYPVDYFNPLDDATGRLNITSNTRSIHWYSKTWLPTSPLKIKLIRFCHRHFGVNCFVTIKRILKK
ncbi:glycosyltransferase family 32 protein [Bacteroides zhangwenhongii]|uniref:glycosyltransferase family 32 protein n=1 Tax=Bacteroides zhangwenhongii TaxID=2650157 RepID=UPI003AAB8023